MGVAHTRTLSLRHWQWRRGTCAYSLSLAHTHTLALYLSFPPSISLSLSHTHSLSQALAVAPWDLYALSSYADFLDHATGTEEAGWRYIPLNPEPHTLNPAPCTLHPTP